MKPHCIILGAGWSGLSAALHLSHQRPDFAITILEAAPSAGGRARGVLGLSTHLDNGQHIILNSCSNLLELYKILNVNTDHLFFKLPLEFWIENRNFFSLKTFNYSKFYQLLKFKLVLRKNKPLSHSSPDSILS